MALIETIDNKIDGFDSRVVVYLATVFIERIRPILKKVIKAEDRTELNYYLLSLERIIEPRGGKITELKQPDNFTITELQLHFEPKLTVREVAFFLHYLKYNDYLPNYSNLDIGRLAEFFFAKNKQDIRTEVREIMKEKWKKQELENFKKTLQVLINSIDSDIIKAK